MFIDEIKSKISPLWEMGFNTPFVQELIKGDLSKEAFERYLQQDSVYLENYVKLCKIAMSKAKTNKEREIIRSLIEFSNDTELQQVRPAQTGRRSGCSSAPPRGKAPRSWHRRGEPAVSDTPAAAAAKLRPARQARC